MVLQRQMLQMHVDITLQTCLNCISGARTTLTLSYLCVICAPPYLNGACFTRMSTGIMSVTSSIASSDVLTALQIHKATPRKDQAPHYTQEEPSSEPTGIFTMTTCSLWPSSFPFLRVLSERSFSTRLGKYSGMLMPTNAPLIRFQLAELNVFLKYNTNMSQQPQNPARLLQD